MRNEKGHTLIELMVASGLIVFAMLALATMLTQQRSSYTHLQQTMEAMGVGGRIQAFLTAEADCTRNFQNLNPNSALPIPIPTLIDSNAIPRFFVNQKFANLVHIFSMNIKPGLNILPNSSGIVELETTFGLEKTGAQSALRPRSNLIYVETNAAGTIQKCSTKAANNYSCRRVAVGGNNRTSAVAICDQPWEQLMSCGFEDNNMSETNPNMTIPIVPSVTQPAVAVNYSFNPIADAHVSSAFPTNNYGGAPNLNSGLGPPIEETYIQFDLTSTVGTVNLAILYLWATNATTDGPQIFRTALGATWNEGTITYNTGRPATVGGSFGDLGAVGIGWTGYDITALLIANGPGVYTFVLRGTSTDAIGISSKDGATPPELDINVTQTNVATPGTGGECRCADTDTSYLMCYALCCRM